MLLLLEFSSVSSTLLLSRHTLLNRRSFLRSNSSAWSPSRSRFYCSCCCPSLSLTIGSMNYCCSDYYSSSSYYYLSREFFLNELSFALLRYWPLTGDWDSAIGCRYWSRIWLLCFLEDLANWSLRCWNCMWFEIRADYLLSIVAIWFLPFLLLLLLLLGFKRGLELPMTPLLMFIWLLKRPPSWLLSSKSKLSTSEGLKYFPSFFCN